MTLEIRQLHHSYREGSRIRPVLVGLNLQVAAGECVALLGRSGSGKSTLLNLMAGIDLPERGEILEIGKGRIVREGWVEQASVLVGDAESV